MMAGACMLALLFRPRRMPFGAHVVFELHYVSFLYLLTILLGVVLALSSTSPSLGVAATLAVIAPYLFIALKRVYGGSTGRILWKCVVMIAFAFLFDNLVNLLAFMATLKLV